MKPDKTIVFSPFARVEGDLRLDVDIANGQVVSAHASGTLFRGFEQLVRGRDPSDAIVILCRICGQCGAAHSAAAAGALADAYGVQPPANGILAASVIQAVELILSHLAHFYSSFAADLCDLPGGKSLQGRFAPIRGRSFQKALRARHTLLGLMGLFAGKWPNTLAIQPGGVTKTLNRTELIRARGILAEFVRFIEGQLLRCDGQRWLENRSWADVEAWLGEGEHEDGDLGCFLAAALRAGLDEMGRGPGRFVSSGAFRLPGDGTWLKAGYYDGNVENFRPSRVTEDVTSSWFESVPADADPGGTAAVSAPEKEGAYSWIKAPRYGGMAAEVGPMARMVIDGDLLVTDLLQSRGPSVLARVLTRHHEIIRLLQDLPGWLAQIDPQEPFCVAHRPAEVAEGFAVTEAPRGLLGHWIRIEHSRIKNYQVVTPTGWNLSPRDSGGTPGPLEQALVGTPVEDAAGAANVALVVRSYDPCLYCSVH